MGQPLTIVDFQTAVADSPHLGHAMMKNIDIEQVPGAMKVAKKFISATNLVTTRTFTAVAATDLCTASATLMPQASVDAGINFNGAAVTFSTSGALPSPLVVGTVYFLIYVSDTTFKVATTLSNALASTAIDITDAGTSSHTVTAVPVGTINHYAKDPNTSLYYALDSNGRVWYTRGTDEFYLLTGNTITNASGNGLCVFRNSDSSNTYLFVFRNAVIDVIVITALANLNTPVWTTAWQTMNTAAGTANRHHAILGQDNIIYFTDDRYVGSILEKAGSVFSPGSAGTYTFNNQALSLPQGEYGYCLAELGVNLLTGGNNTNQIYPWDRVSVSFALPLLCPEKKIYNMINSGNQIYILAGSKGNIYVSQGTYVRFFKQIPLYLSAGAAGNYHLTNVTWGGMAVRSGAILVGVGTFGGTNSGVYILYPDGRLLQDNTPYAGEQVATAFWVDSDYYYMGSAGGLDFTQGSRPAQATYTAVYQSELYKVGNKTSKQTYSELEIQCATIPAGNIRVGYRYSTEVAFTTLTTFVGGGTSPSFQVDAGLTDLENIQFQFEFDSNVEIIKAELQE